MMSFIHVSYSSIVGATYHLKICSNPVQDKSLLFSSAWKRKKNWRLSKATKIGNFIREIPGPCLALTHSPGLFLHKMGFEIMCNDYLVRKKACIDFKNIDFRGLPYWIFLRRSNHDFGQKLEFSPLFVFGQKEPWNNDFGE